MKHTPAPWKHEELFDGDESLGITIKAGRDEIAHISSIGHQDFANAALIAAAPELLTALQAMVKLVTRTAMVDLPEVAQAVHVIAKATESAA
jgi:hypothetical protein